MRPYQKKLRGSFEQRWQRIADVLPAESRNLLDIGCNLGDFTARAAEAGYWSLGIERHDYLVRKARRIHRHVPHCAFMISELGVADCEKIAPFDITLVLSVYHNWYKALGKEEADRILHKLVARTNHVLIFEGPSRTSRFGERDLPEFIDNDEASVTGYYEKLIEEVAGPLTSHVQSLGKTPCVGEREPYRWMYALFR